MPTAPSNPISRGVAAGDAVLFHFETRRGLTTRPALVIESHADGTAELHVLVGLDVDISSDFYALDFDRRRVPAATGPTAGHWTAKE